MILAFYGYPMGVLVLIYWYYANVVIQHEKMSDFETDLTSHKTVCKYIISILSFYFIVLNIFKKHNIKRCEYKFVSNLFKPIFNVIMYTLLIF